MKNIKILLLFFLSPLFVFAQDEDVGLRYEDYVYLDNIYSIKFTSGGLARNYPIVRLQSNSQLVLKFDVIGDDVRDYLYTIVHCDSDWQPSELQDIDYIDGFNEDDIENYDFSFNTVTNYTNYQLALPNGDISWTKSGNYLLKIYDDTDDKKLAITRRFVVADSRVAINGAMRRPANNTKNRTHQELDFIINFDQFPIRNPHTDIKVVVLQNGRWDTSIEIDKPMFVKPEELIYDFQDKIVFPAGKEFRFADIRTFEYRTNSIFEVSATRDHFDVTLHKDIDRTNQPYLSGEDLNGKYVIESMEQRDGDLRAEYGHILFALDESPAFSNHDVYLFGEFTDWRIQERFKMTYNPLVNGYVGKVLLKQGFYDYMYAVVDRETGTIDLSELEGDWHEAENDYTVIVYYAPFGARYEQVIGIANFNSVR
ncbi:MAG: DUF5103 domain-containing protein [Saprospiraceae bacterium]